MDKFDQEAQKVYGKDFSKLSKEKKEEIRVLIRNK